MILSPNAEDGSFKVYQDMKLWRYQFKANHQEALTLNTERNYWLQVVKGSFTLNGQTVETSDGVAISQETLANIETHSDVEFLLFDLA